MKVQTSAEHRSESESHADAPPGVESIEAFLVEIWQGLFETNDIDAGSDFFELGGNSITAIKLLARVDAAYGDDALPPEALFSTGPLGEIAAAIARTLESRRTGCEE
jgi:hypothetical protein